MYRKTVIGSALLAAAILAGCGGGGGGSSAGSSSVSTTRTLVGFVYVKSATNTTASAPQVVVSPAATPPSGYDKPTSGYLSLIVSSGQFLASQSGSNNTQIFTRDLNPSDTDAYGDRGGNDILVTVATSGTTLVTVAGDDIVSNGSSMTLTQYTENLSDGYATGTTHNLSSPTNPDTRKPNRSTIGTVAFTLDGWDGVASGSTNAILAGQQRIIALAFLDANGISVPGIPAYGSGVTLTSDSARVTINAATNTITAASQGQYPGTANITATISSPSSASGTLPFSFSYGAATAVALSMKTSSGSQRIDLSASTTTVPLRWNVITNVRSSSLPTYETLYALVTNKYGAPIPGVQIDWTDPKVDSTDIWKTTSGGYAFVDPTTFAPTPNSTTDLTGTATVVFQTPSAVDGPLAGLPADLNDANGSGDQAVKGQQRVVATVDGATTATYSTEFYVTRQINSLAIVEAQISKYEDVNAYTSVPYTCYAVDVDNWQSLDTFAAYWRCTAVTGGVKLGDPGERDLASHLSATPSCTMSGNTLVTGSIPGGAQIQAYTEKADGSDDVVSPTYTVDIWGPPKQLVCLYGPVPAAPTEPWETGEFPEAIYTAGNGETYTDPVSQFVASQFIPNSLTAADVTADLCYMYLGWIDASGVGDYTQYGNSNAGYDLYGNLAPVIGTTDLTVTYQSPSPPPYTSAGSASDPTSPVGALGSQCVILTWGPLTGNEGSVTLEYKGTWDGSISTSPLPTSGLAFDVTRIIRINGDPTL
jgi:hypothetical protein